MTDKKQILKTAKEISKNIGKEFYQEVEKILNSKGVNGYNKRLIFGVALDNIVDRLYSKQVNKIQTCEICKKIN